MPSYIVEAYKGIEEDRKLDLDFLLEKAVRI